jgi:hypothetical protein
MKIALLSLSDDFAQFLDWIGPFDETLIVPVPSAAQPLNEMRHSVTPSAKSGRVRNHFGEE